MSKKSKKFKAGKLAERGAAAEQAERKQTWNEKDVRRPTNTRMRRVSGKR